MDIHRIYHIRVDELSMPPPENNRAAESSPPFWLVGPPLMLVARAASLYLLASPRAG